jgi:hypothetical protein
MPLPIRELMSGHFFKPLKFLEFFADFAQGNNTSPLSFAWDWLTVAAQWPRFCTMIVGFWPGLLRNVVRQVGASPAKIRIKLSDFLRL